MTASERAEIKEILEGLDDIHVRLLLSKNNIRILDCHGGAKVDLMEKTDHVIKTLMKKRENLINMVTRGKGAATVLK